MSTKRTPLRRDAKARLTPETIALWVRLEAIQAAGDHNEWEPLGRRREYLDGNKALCGSLGLWWGYTSPLNAVTADPPDYMRHNELQADAWRQAWAWRCALQEGARADRSPAAELS
jgi:hypothetical protein